ncbi:MAG: cellulase family glycosylhydrolase [Lachnospiraceae bacterium]|nr:cellulase family glycosylhydrolase [Lachnospiraceae bacterium]
MKYLNASALLPAILRRFLLGCLMAMLVCGNVYAEDTADGAASVLTPYEAHGQLSVTGTNLTNEYGELFQMRGVSTAGLAWFPDYVSKDTFRTLRDKWNVNTIRLAMYTDEYGGYCVTDDAGRQALKQLVLDGVQAASDLGMYVIIDWHILSDGNPNTYKDMSLAFFQEISLTLSGYDNVIYEICNEPNSGTSWDSIRSYAVDVIDAIRLNSPESIVIVGTPTWSQDVDVAAQNPIDRENLLYALHFYANTHKEDLRQKAVTAIESGLPLIVSEFGISDASGNGELSTEQGDLWLSMLEYYQIGYVMWNLSNKEESSALLKPESTLLSDWMYEDLSDSARWFVSRMTGEVSLPIYYPDSSYAPSSAAAGTGESWFLSNGCSVTTTINNSWSDGTSQWYEYDVSIANPTAAPVSNWRLRLTWASDVGFDQYWSCDIGGSSNSYLFVPKDYNAVINSGSSINFGFICTGSTAQTLIGVAFE